MKGRVKPKQHGTPEEHLRYMLKYALRFADGDAVAAAAEALASRVGAARCPRSDYDCRPGACDCAGAGDALRYAIAKYERGESFAPTERQGS